MTSKRFLQSNSDPCVPLIDIDVDAIGKKIMDTIEERFNEFVNSLCSNDRVVCDLYERFVENLRLGGQYPMIVSAENMPSRGKSRIVPHKKYRRELEAVITDRDSLFRGMRISWECSEPYSIINWIIEPNKKIKELFLN